MVVVSEQLDLESTEGLRFLLLRLAYSGERAWQEESEVADLIEFLTTKYAALANKYGLEPADAAYAAFEVMRTRAARVANDTWAVITRAVQLSLIYEARAQGLMISNQHARRADVVSFHDPERFSERENPLTDFHPSLHAPPAPDLNAPTTASTAVTAAITLFVENGWDEGCARMTIEHICSVLSTFGDRRVAYGRLRRDAKGRESLELDQTAWITVLRLVLGDPRRDYEGTRRERGLLLRLCLGEDLDELGADETLTSMIATAAPTVAGETHV